MRTNDRIAQVFARPKIAGLLLLLLVLTVSSIGHWTEPKSKALLRQAILTQERTQRIALLEQALVASNHDDPEAATKLCLAYAESKKWSDVDSRFSQVDPSVWKADDLLQLANLSLQAAQWKLAERVIAAMPDNPNQLETKLRLQCRLYQGSGDQHELLNAAQRLCHLDPKNHRYWWQLARIHESHENKLAAIMTYESALQQPIPQTDKNQMRHRSLSHCIDIGDVRRARHEFKALTLEGERGPIMDVNNARILHLEGHPDQALVSLQAALSELGEVPDGLRLRGILYLELDRVEEAIRDFNRVVESASQDEMAYFKLAEAYRRLARRSGDESTMQLARRYHEQYQQIHTKQLKINQLHR